MGVETVTVLFTDLVGSTALMARIGEEAAEAVRSEHVARLRVAIAAFDGREVKNLGDGVMVVFAGAGAALGCAVAMQQAIAAQRVDGEAVGLRIGVAAGEVDVVDGDYFGIPVVEAARLCAQTAGGEIYTTDLVRSLVRSRGGFELDTLGPLELKGLGDPVEAFRVRWTQPTVAAGVVPVPQRVTSVADAIVVGRAEALLPMESAWKQVVAGERQAVLISGEPGIGKTTMAARFALEAASDGATVLFGRCDEDLGITYQPWIEALGHLVTHADDNLVKGHLDACGAVLARLLPELRSRAGMVPDAVRDLDVERHRLFAAVCDLLERGAGEAPLVLVLDDLHWADPATVQLLRHVLLADYGAALLVLGTFRDSDLGADAPFVELLAHLHRESGVQRVVLRGLDDADVLDLLQQLAGHELDADGVALRDALMAETDGNPFFIGELLRHLRSSGAIKRDGENWIAGDDLRTAGLPVSIREVVGRRVRWLGADTHRLLTLASVIGRQFDVDVLARVADVDPDTVIDLCDTAVAAAVLRETAQVDRYTFAHALIERSLYDELSASRRARAHHSVAEVLEADCGADPGARAGELAHHWACASRPSDTAKAYTYARLAGDRALAQLAPTDALRWYGDAVGYLDPDEHGTIEAIEVRIDLGRAQHLTGDLRRRDTLVAAGRDALIVGRPELAIEALSITSGASTGTATMAEPDRERIEVLRAALAGLPEDRTPLRIRATALLADELGWDPTAETERRELIGEALDAALELGDPAVLAEVVSVMTGSMACAVFHEEHIRLAARVIELAGNDPDPITRAVAHQAAANVAYECADRDALEIHIAAIRQAGAEIGVPFYLASANEHLSLLAQLDADPARIEEQANTFLQGAVDAGQPAWGAVGWGAALLTAGFQQGNLGEMIPAIEQSIADNPGLRVYRTVLAFAFAVERDIDKAAVLLEAERDGGFDHPRDSNWLYDHCCWAQVAADVGELGATALLVQRIEALSHVMAVPRSAAGLPAAYSVGRAHLALGDADLAIDDFDLALAMGRSLRAPHFMAMTEVALAGALEQRNAGDDRTRAHAFATQAHRAAVDGGFGYVARDASEILTRLQT